MHHLVTTDNNLGKPLISLNCSGEKAVEVYKDLSAISNASLREISSKNPSLIVFPKILGNSNDGIEEQKIIELSGINDIPEKANITTGNLMGFIGCGNTEISIHSRFTGNQNNSNGDEDYFLHYMLEKVGVLNLFDLQHSSSKDRYFDFLLFLFPLFLKKALIQGVFKTYQQFKRNDANIKGVIDVPRHIRQNNPFAGCIAYNNRERTFDNYITQLIRHTIEFIKTKSNGKFILFRDAEIKDAVSEIIQATPSYNLRERRQIISKNIKPLNHPYFTAYKPLQKLCLAILRHQKGAYRQNSNQIYGILFDGAWLWEEYLALVLKKDGFKHPKNKQNSGGIRMFQNDFDENSFDKNFRRIYPDFYRLNTNDKKGNILDAKYKRLQNGVGREDLYQVVTYMHTMKIDCGGFLYPIEDSNLSDILHNCYKLSEIGYGGEIHVIGIKIPKVNNVSPQQGYYLFNEKMKIIEDTLLNLLRNNL